MGPPADPLTLALALNETLTLADALAAPAISPAQPTASPPRLVPAVTTFPAAWTASGPCTWIAEMIAGKFFETVLTRAVTCAEALPWQERLTDGGVHIALAFA